MPVVAKKTPGAAPSKTPKEKPFILPKTLAGCADLLYTTRQERLGKGKEVEELERRESLLSAHLIDNLPKSQAQGITGRLARATIVTKDVPTVEDWAKLYKHIQKTGDFTLLQRRLGDASVKEYWDARKKVPGVGAFRAVKVSLSKV